MLNVNGPHPMTWFFILFLRAVRNISHQFTLKLEAQEWSSSHFGKFTTKCAMLWTRIFCSRLPPPHMMKRTHLHLKNQTQINCHFTILGLVNLAKMEFPPRNLHVKVKPTIYHAFLLPNLLSFQNILQSLVRENLVRYFKAHFSECSRSHYKMTVTTSWSSSQTTKAMSYIDLFTRNPSARPVSVVFDLFTYYNEYLWLVAKIYLSKWYLRNVESTWGSSSMPSRIDLTGLTSYDVYDLVVHLPTKGLIRFISLVNILSYFVTNTSPIGIQS
jgi:hypothetical protein